MMFFRRALTFAFMPPLTSYPKEKIKILLLEGVHPEGVRLLRDEGFAVESRAEALDETDLLKAVDGVFVLGIRSKTRLTPRVLNKASRLLTVGAFCIGTNQVDLQTAMKCGIPVFNAPFSNTRSVTDLVIANILMLFRGLAGKIEKAHQGIWDKSTSGCFEVRGKTLGIIGYGHIGSQVSILAEALGMRVTYYDIIEKLSLGNAVRTKNLQNLLEQSDCVTLHVPETAETRGMIGAKQLAWMKPSAFLINTSRGSVVDIAALVTALRTKKITGAAIDVFPKEPNAAGERFESPLQGLPNVILTPHIGGATVEAQRNIGLEVAVKLIRFINNGSTEGAVNFPNAVLPDFRGVHRILHIHKNVPGVLQKINTMFGEAGINIASQELRTYGEVGYLIMDTDMKATKTMTAQMQAMPETIKVRALF